MENQKDYNEKLNVIYGMIEHSKSQIKENAFFYLLWGWLVLIASLSHFMLMRLEVYYSFLAWPVLMTIGMVISIVAGIRLGKKSGYRTHIDTSVIYLWYGFLFTILVVLAFAIAGRINWGITNVVIISLYGLGTFVSGGILKFKPLIIGGICCWIIALAGFVVPLQYSLLLVSVSIVIAYLIPGYLLRRAN